MSDILEQRKLHKIKQRIYQLYVTDWMIKTIPYDDVIEEDISDILSFNQFVDNEIYKKYYQLYMRDKKLQRIINE